MKFTIEQIKNYLRDQDSLGNALYNLSEANIMIANMAEGEELYENEDSMEKLPF